MIKFLEVQPESIGIIRTDNKENDKQPFMVVYLKDLEQEFLKKPKRKKRSLNSMEKSIAKRPERQINPYSGDYTLKGFVKDALSATGYFRAAHFEIKIL